MNPVLSSALDRARRQLRAIEADRRAAGVRFRNAKAWDNSFDEIVKLERRRDSDLRQQIKQARATGRGDSIFTLFEQYNNQIGADANCYQARKKDLRVLHEHWKISQPRAILASEELNRHYARLDYRLCQRQVVL